MTSVRYDSLSSLSACRSSERYLFDDNFCLVNLPGLSSLGRHVAHLDIYLAVRTPKSKQAVASKKKGQKDLQMKWSKLQMLKICFLY